MALRDTIKEITKKHLKENNTFLYAQCVQAVGWIGGTVPNDVPDHIVELPTSDVMNGGIVAGCALMGKRPIYVIRYQGFNWFNLPIILNYSCKSKEMWNIPSPMFIRSIAMENNIGPVASSSHISIAYKMPGIKILSPMTSKEYQQVYDQFMNDDDVYLVSEHRGSFNNENELEDKIIDDPDIVLLPISITRFEAEKARIKLQEMGYNVGIKHIWQIKPNTLLNDKKAIEMIQLARTIIIIDDDYTDGIAKNIAYDLASVGGRAGVAFVLGLENRTAGFHKEVDNLPPTCDTIVKFVEKECK